MTQNHRPYTSLSVEDPTPRPIFRPEPADRSKTNEPGIQSEERGYLSLVDGHWDLLEPDPAVSRLRVPMIERIRPDGQCDAFRERFARPRRNALVLSVSAIRLMNAAETLWRFCHGCHGRTPLENLRVHRMRGRSAWVLGRGPSSVPNLEPFQNRKRIGAVPCSPWVSCCANCRSPCYVNYGSVLGKLGVLLHRRRQRLCSDRSDVRA